MQVRDTSDAGTFLPSDRYWHGQNSTYYFRPGYQFQYAFNKVQLFWGADLHFYYYTFYQDYFFMPVLVNNNQYYDQYNERTFTRLQYGIVALGGGIIFSYTKNFFIV